MIKIENLYKTYRSKDQVVEAVKDVTLTIEDGEIFGVIGYSGAGKSTLVRCMNLLELPDRGRIEVNGQLLFQKDDSGELLVRGRELNRARRGIGMIFQHFNLLDRSTVFENIAYPLQHSGMSRREIAERVRELLQLVDLSEKENSYPSQLSGGQKQRVAIARAIANNPQVLLSDEATSALDPEATESILDLLKDLNRKLGLTIVIITHEMAIIKAITDRVAVMEDGVITEEGETYEVFAHPKAAITRRFVESASSLGKLPALIRSDEALKAASLEGRLVQLIFDKNSVGDARISQLSRRFDVSANIVLANIEVLQAGTLGNLVCELKGSPEGIALAKNFLSENHVETEVIRYEFDH